MIIPKLFRLFEILFSDSRQNFRGATKGQIIKKVLMKSSRIFNVVCVRNSVSFLQKCELVGSTEKQYRSRIVYVLFRIIRALVCSDIHREKQWRRIRVRSKKGKYLFFIYFAPGTCIILIHLSLVTSTNRMFKIYETTSWISLYLHRRVGQFIFNIVSF